MPDEHWGRRPRDWAALAEPSNSPLFAAVLHRLGVAAGVRLLDIGCGSGYACELAARSGAAVTGIDITPELLQIARERVPTGEFVLGGMDALPFERDGFDLAVGFNAFPFATDPLAALREAARVVRTDGMVAATTFAEPERNESTALHLALEPLRAVERDGAAAPGHLPYALSGPGGLEQLMASAGLEVVEAGEVPLAWTYSSVDHAVRAVLASGGGAMAIENAGEPRARAALERAVAPFTHPDGSVRMDNVFRFVIGRVGEPLGRGG